MTTARSNELTRWDLRVERARELAREASSAREILTFYAGLAEFQRSLCSERRVDAPEALAFPAAVDLEAAAAAVPDFLTWLGSQGPPPVASGVAELLRLEPDEWLKLFRRSLEEDELAGTGDRAAFVVEALMQPFAEKAALAFRERPEGGPHAARCPICGGQPLVGTLREAGHGARRTLICARCLSEWEFLRVLCAACGEERFDKLPVFTTTTVEHVRLEACDNCRRYLKTIDLTKNGLAVPIVDDLASVTLDLWAREQGYSRIRANLLRT